MSKDGLAPIQNIEEFEKVLQAITYAEKRAYEKTDLAYMTDLQLGGGKPPLKSRSTRPAVKQHQPHFSLQNISSSVQKLNEIMNGVYGPKEVLPTSESSYRPGMQIQVDALTENQEGRGSQRRMIDVGPARQVNQLNSEKHDSLKGFELDSQKLHSQAYDIKSKLELYNHSKDPQATGQMQTISEEISRGTITSAMNIDARSMKSQPEQLYNKSVGFDIYFDFCSKMFNHYPSMKMVYTIQNQDDQLIDPIQVDRCYAQVDPNDNDMYCIMIRKSNLIKGIEADERTNFVVEVQVPKDNQDNENWLISYGWTILDLFNSNGSLNTGIWKLPLYQSPTVASLDVADIRNLKPIPYTTLCVRVAHAQRDLDEDIRFHDSRNGEKPSEYTIPDIHKFHDFDHKKEKSQRDDSEEVSIAQSVEQEVEVGYEGKGIILKLHQINNYFPPSSTIVTAQIFHNQKVMQTVDFEECKLVTRAKDSGHVKRNKEMYTRENDRSYGRYMRLGEQVHWEQNFYRLYKEAPRKDDMILLIEVQEQWIPGIDLDGDNKSDASQRSFLRKFTKFEREDEQRVFAYTIMKINNPDGTIKYGTFELNLFRPPVKLRNLSVKDQIGEKNIKITIQMPEDKNLDELQEELEEIQEEQRQQEILEEAAKVKEIPYVDCKLKYVDLSKFYQRGQGIDFYIDQARYLPDCVTITRLLVRGITKNQTKVIPTTKALAEINESTRMIQSFNHRIEIRPETLVVPEPMLNPTTFLEIIVETIDRYDMKEKIIGFAYFPLFLNPNGNGAPTNMDVNQQYLFNEGCYQIPIYEERVADKDVTQQNIWSLKKISCATLLVRAYPCPQENGKNLSLEQSSNLAEQQLLEKGIIRDIPGVYSKPGGVYNNVWCFTDSAEQRLYNFKHKRYNPVMNLIVGYIFSRKGIVSQSKQIQMENINSEIDRMFGKASVFKQKVLKRFENSYEPSYGFKFSVVRLHNLQEQQKNLAHFVIIYIVPPGRLLQAVPDMGPDVHVFKDQDFDGTQNSKWFSLQFSEEMNYIQLPAQDKIGFILEVKAYDYKQRQVHEVKTLGWAYVPLFVAMENENKTFSLFTNSGLIQIPLFKGEVNKRELIAALKSEDPGIALTRSQDLTFVDQTSVIIRVHDNQQSSKPDPSDFADLDTSNLPSKNMQQYYFNLADVQKSKEKTAAQVLNVDEERHKQKVKEAIKKLYGFDYPKI